MNSFIEIANTMGFDKGGHYFQKTFRNARKVMFWLDRQLIQITDYDGFEHTIDYLSNFTPNPTSIYYVYIELDGNFQVIQNAPLPPTQSPVPQPPDVAVMHPPLATFYRNLPPPSGDAAFYPNVQKVSFDAVHGISKVILRDGFEISYDLFESGFLFPFPNNWNIQTVDYHSISSTNNSDGYQLYFGY